MKPEVVEILVVVVKLVIQGLWLWLAYTAGKQGWLERRNKWYCPHDECKFSISASQAWVMERVRDDHLMKFHWEGAPR